MLISLTEFALRHFDADRAGTIITSQSPEQFEKGANVAIDRLRPGYADFCKLAFVENWTDARAGTLHITPENERFLKSGYKVRTDGEMPVLVRWFEGVKSPRAEYLCIVLYSAEQLSKEGNPVNADYGIVAILGQMDDQEEPMSPITMWRNALGIKVGGSGAAIDPEAYARSAEFWDTHAAVYADNDGQKPTES